MWGNNSASVATGVATDVATGGSRAESPRAQVAHFTLNFGGEGEVRTHGTLVRRFSSLGQDVRGGSRMAVSRGNRPIPGPRIRRCSPLLLPAVATGSNRGEH